MPNATTKTRPPRQGAAAEVFAERRILGLDRQVDRGEEGEEGQGERADAQAERA